MTEFLRFNMSNNDLMQVLQKRINQKKENFLNSDKVIFAKK